MQAPRPARIAAILLGAGTGSRFGAAQPKQFAIVAGRPVLRHAAETLARDGALLQPVGDAAAIGAALDGMTHLPVVPAGATRQASVRAALEALPSLPPELSPDIVLVHDGARPHLPPATVPAL